MNSQQIEERILAKVKQINFQLSELQSRLAASDSNQIKLHIASLKGRRRGLLETLQLLNESWKDTDSLLNTYQHLGTTPEEQRPIAKRAILSAGNELVQGTIKCF